LGRQEFSGLGLLLYLVDETYQWNIDGNYYFVPFDCDMKCELTMVVSMLIVGA